MCVCLSVGMKPLLNFQGHTLCGTIQGFSRCEWAGWQSHSPHDSKQLSLLFNLFQSQKLNNILEIKSIFHHLVSVSLFLALKITEWNINEISETKTFLSFTIFRDGILLKNIFEADFDLTHSLTLLDILQSQSQINALLHCYPILPVFHPVHNTKKGNELANIKAIILAVKCFTYK